MARTKPHNYQRMKQQWAREASPDFMKNPWAPMPPNYSGPVTASERLGAGGDYDHISNNGLFQGKTCNDPEESQTARGKRRGKKAEVV